MQSYLTMMAVGLIEIRRILKPSGTMYLHCDTTAGGYLRVLCDFIFGYAQYRNEVRWKRTYAHGRARRFAPIHDMILLYSRSDGYQWNKVYQPYDAKYVDNFYRTKNEHGERYRTVSLTAPGLRSGESGEPWRGVDPSTRGGGQQRQQRRTRRTDDDVVGTGTGGGGSGPGLPAGVDLELTRLLHKQPPAHVKRRRSVLREHIGALFPGFRCCSWRGPICRLGESCVRHIG